MYVRRMYAADHSSGLMIDRSLLGCPFFVSQIWRRCTSLSLQLKITHYYHSGFSVACDDILLIFDYWRGENRELPPERSITAEELQKYNKVFVMISHEHPDHYDQDIIYTWREYADVTYIVSYDMPVGTRGKRMSPGDEMDLADGIRLTAYGSTDLGISFLVDIDGLKIFHAGDLNYWHWRDESTMAEIQEAEEEFTRKVRPLSSIGIDIAMFPVDPRQGSMYEAGVNFFILTAKPRLLIPMHYFHRSDIIMEYSRLNRTRSTEILAMPGYGDSIAVTRDENGYIDIRLLRLEGEDITSEQSIYPVQPDEDPLDPDNPFMETDLPVMLPDQDILDPVVEDPEGTEDLPENDDSAAFGEYDPDIEIPEQENEDGE